MVEDSQTYSLRLVFGYRSLTGAVPHDHGNASNGLDMKQPARFTCPLPLRTLHVVLDTAIQVRQRRGSNKSMEPSAVFRNYFEFSL